jgi:hypothetical protein
MGAHPFIDSIEIAENNINLYKTQIKLKNFIGESICVNKKISKVIEYLIYIEKASFDLITVEDSIRIYINTKSITRNCTLKQ